MVYLEKRVLVGAVLVFIFSLLTSILVVSTVLDSDAGVASSVEGESNSGEVSLTIEESPGIGSGTGEVTLRIDSSNDNEG